MSWAYLAAALAHFTTNVLSVLRGGSLISERSLGLFPESDGGKMGLFLLYVWDCLLSVVGGCGGSERSKVIIKG